MTADPRIPRRFAPDVRVEHDDTGRYGLVTRVLSPTYVSVHWLTDGGPLRSDEHVADLTIVDDEPTICEWFALCDHVATQTRPHPVLGDVPICDRCAARVDALS